MLQDGDVDFATSLDTLIKWAREFEDDNLELVRIEIVSKNLKR